MFEVSAFLDLNDSACVSDSGESLTAEEMFVSDDCEDNVNAPSATVTPSEHRDVNCGIWTARPEQDVRII